MKTKLPVRAASFARRHPELWKAFENLADECHKAGPLDAKTRRLVKLGIALGAGLEGAVHAQVRNALAEGATGAELRHVAFLGITTIGFPASISGLTWMNDLLNKPSRKR